MLIWYKNPAINRRILIVKIMFSESSVENFVNHIRRNLFLKCFKICLINDFEAGQLNGHYKRNICGKVSATFGFIELKFS